MMLASLALALAAATVAASPSASARDAAVRAAIERGIVERMGRDALVTVDRLEVHAPDSVMSAAGAAARDIRAVLPPGARTGRLVSFVLLSGRARVGSATAFVKVTIPHVRAARPVPRDTELTALDTAELVSDLDGALFERLPGPADLIGARVRRDVAAGEPLTHATVETPFAVRSGDTVEMIVRLGLVEARGVGHASGSGHVGERVRVSRPGQPGLAAARIIAPGVVELVETFAQVPAARSRRAEERR
jgi:flagella basal body P-ring formation protein FlgA